MSKASLVKIGDKSITRYSNALVRRTLEEIAVNNSTKQNKTDLLTRKSNDLAVAIKEVKIGDQIWSTENLNVERYRNGDPIPEVKDPDEWSKLKTGAWCYYDNDPENGKKYGKLYNWYAVNDPRGLAPEGWHVPTKKEFEKLIETLHENGNALKAVGQGEDDGAGTNTSGFSALLLSGYRGYSSSFNKGGGVALFWSSTAADDVVAYSICLYSHFNTINLTYYSSAGMAPNINRPNGKSVRCLKDKDNLNVYERSKSIQHKPVIKEVKIGDQIWSTENLNVERYRNGDPIPEVKDPDEWSKLKTGAWCYYDNDPENGKKYGKLYNWYAVNDPRGLAPEGWHVPTKKEFEKLIETLHESGNTLRIIVQDDDLGAGTNTSGFSALMAGYRTSHYKFTNLGYYTYFWSSTDCYDSPYLTDNAHYVYLYYDSSIYFHYHYKKEYGFSVRCVKD